MIQLEIFDSRGKLRSAASFTDEEREALTPERQQRFDALRAAAEACERAESDLTAGHERVAAAAVAFNEAQDALNKLRPKVNFMDLWRDSTS